MSLRRIASKEMSNTYATRRSGVGALGETKTVRFARSTNSGSRNLRHVPDAASGRALAIVAE
jgi:hypothetical protein